LLGFPTIKIFPSKIQPTKDGKGFEKIPEDYNGARTAAAIANYAVDKMPNFVAPVTSKNVDKFLAAYVVRSLCPNIFSEPELAKVILFTDKDKTPNMYKSLAIDYHFELNLGEVRKTDKDLGKRDCVYFLTCFS
jgi:protein disulfide-isomerase A6